MERRFLREIRSLNDVFDYIAEFMSSNRINNSEAFSLQFIVEELFTNMIKYNRGGLNEIAVGLQKEGETVVMQLTDYDVDEFDVTKIPEARVSLPLGERTAGGLGVHLVRKMVDGMTYGYSNRVGTIVVRKSLGRDDVQRSDRKP